MGRHFRRPRPTPRDTPATDAVLFLLLMVLPGVVFLVLTLTKVVTVLDRGSLSLNDASGIVIFGVSALGGLLFGYLGIQGFNDWRSKR
jgi:hypothetical protein